MVFPPKTAMWITMDNTMECCTFDLVFLCCFARSFRLRAVQVSVAVADLPFPPYPRALMLKKSSQHFLHRCVVVVVVVGVGVIVVVIVIVVVASENCGVSAHCASGKPPHATPSHRKPLSFLLAPPLLHPQLRAMRSLGARRHHRRPPPQCVGRRRRGLGPAAVQPVGRSSEGHGDGGEARGDGAQAWGQAARAGLRQVSTDPMLHRYLGIHAPRQREGVMVVHVAPEALLPRPVSPTSCDFIVSVHRATRLTNQQTPVSVRLKAEKTLLEGHDLGPCEGASCGR